MKRILLIIFIALLIITPILLYLLLRNSTKQEGEVYISKNHASSTFSFNKESIAYKEIMSLVKNKPLKTYDQEIAFTDDPDSTAVFFADQEKNKIAGVSFDIVEGKVGIKIYLDPSLDQKKMYNYANSGYLAGILLADLYLKHPLGDKQLQSEIMKKSFSIFKKANKINDLPLTF